MVKNKTFSVDIAEGLNGKSKSIYEAFSIVGISSGFITAILIPTLPILMKGILIGAGIIAGILLLKKIGDIHVGSIIGNTIKGLYNVIFQLPKWAKAAYKWIVTGIKWLYKKAKDFLKGLYKTISTNISKFIKKYITTPIKDWWTAYKTEFKKQFVQPFMEEIWNPAKRGITRAVDSAVNPIRNGIIKPVQKVLTETIPGIFNRISIGFKSWKVQYKEAITKMGKNFMADMGAMKSSVLMEISKLKILQNSVKALTSIKNLLVKGAFSGQTLAAYKQELLKSGKSIDKTLAGATARSEAFTKQAMSLRKSIRGGLGNLIKGSEIQLNIVVAMYRPKDDATLIDALNPDKWQPQWEYYNQRAEREYNITGTMGNIIGWTYGIIGTVVGAASGVALATTPVTGPFGIAVGLGLATLGTALTDKLADLTSFITAKIQGKRISRNAAFNSGMPIISLFAQSDRDYYLTRDLEEIDKELEDIMDLSRQLEQAKEYLLGGFQGYTPDEVSIFNKLMSPQSSKKSVVLTDLDIIKISGLKQDKTGNSIMLDSEKAHRFLGIYSESLGNVVTMFIESDDAMLSAIGNGVFNKESGDFSKNSYTELSKDDFLPVVSPRFMFTEYMNIRVFSHPTWIAAIQGYWNKRYIENDKWIKAKIAQLKAEEEAKKRAAAAAAKAKKDSSKYTFSQNDKTTLNNGLKIIESTFVVNNAWDQIVYNSLNAYTITPTTNLQTVSSNAYNSSNKSFLGYG